jgi:hypothetical protein
VLAADLLQSVVNKAVLEGDLVHPLGQDFGGSFSIVQYADDTLLVFSADPIQLVHLKEMLLTFASAT